MSLDLSFRETRLHKIVDEIEDYAIILLDADGNIENWNKGAEKIKGYKAEEIIGKNFRLFYTPRDRENRLPEKLIAQAAKDGKAQHEGWRVNKNGKRFWGSVLITSIHGEDQKVIGFTKITRDLTDKKLAKESLRRSEDRYSKMVAEVEDYAIILMDLEGNIENWNKGAEKIKGYKAEEIIGKNFRLFYTKEDIKICKPDSLLEEAVKTGRAQDEGWRVRKDGSSFWASVTIISLHDDLRNIIGFSKLTRDLTERKNAEETLKHYVEELELKNKELEQINYIASHDLQEPLNSILSLLEFIDEDVERSNLEIDSKESLRFIPQVVERMKSLIEGLLGYSQLGSFGKLEQVDCNRLMDELLKDLYAVIKESKASITYENLPEVLVYKIEFQLLFQNLICNAIKFKKQETIPKIIIWAEEEGEFWKFFVKDNGIGIEPEYQEKIFIMFQRLHRVDEYEGTGIGLAHCKKIVDLHGGKIGVDSSLGHGSTFYFTVNKNLV